MKYNTGKRAAWFIAMMLLSISAVHVFADGKKKKADSAANNRETSFDSVQNRYFIFPQFYTYWPIDNNDTILKYDCYDINQHFINVDTLHNVSDIQHILFIKTYIDYTQTTIDADGKPRPTIIVKELYKYDKTGDDTWTSFDYTHNYTGQLKEYRNNIVRSDTTVVIDSATSTKQVTIRRYYKVDEVTDSAMGNQSLVSEVSANGLQTKDSIPHPIISGYLVPQFYFYGQKKNRDTILEFKRYDSHDSLIWQPGNFDSIQYYSLFKTYIDSDHTYRDDDGKKKPLPISTIVKRYDRLSKDKWMSIEYPGNKYMELTEYKDIIVKTDTVTLADPVEGKESLLIYNYYKVVK